MINFSKAKQEYKCIPCFITYLEIVAKDRREEIKVYYCNVLILHVKSGRILFED